MENIRIAILWHHTFEAFWSFEIIEEKTFLLLQGNKNCIYFSSSLPDSNLSLYGLGIGIQKRLHQRPSTKTIFCQDWIQNGQILFLSIPFQCTPFKLSEKNLVDNNKKKTTFCTSFESSIKNSLKRFNQSVDISSIYLTKYKVGVALCKD